MGAIQIHYYENDRLFKVSLKNLTAVKVRIKVPFGDLGAKLHNS